MAKTPNPRAKSIRQKNEAFHVRAMQKHPYIDHIVKQIVAGKPAQSIARWCELSASKAGGVKNYKFLTWRLYVSTLRQRIRSLLTDVEIKEPTPELYEALIDQIRRDNDLPIEEKKSDSRPHMRRISTSVKIAIGEVEAEKVLKYAFLSQSDRIENLIKKENKTGVIDKNGYKEVQVILDIGVALAKLEFGQYLIRAGKVSAGSGGPSTLPTAHEKLATSDWSSRRSHNELGLSSSGKTRRFTEKPDV